MSNLIIHRPDNQQFVQYPHWAAQAKAFSLSEKGLLDIILSFKDYLSKASLANYTSDGKRAIDTAWKGLIQKGILIAKSFKSADNRFAWSYTVNLEKVSILAFHKRLDMNQLEHSNYEKYAQHFRNWLPDFLKYQDVGNKIKTAKQNVVNDSNGSNEKCGSNKDFNILRKKLQNPQADYMTYQDWVIKLAEITENLSPADIAYKNEIVSIYKKGQLRQRFQEMKAKMELLERSN